MNFDEKMAEDYEENADCIEIDDYNHKVYGSLEIEQAYLEALRKGSQLDKIYDASEGKWINRNSELEKKSICISDKLEKEAGDYAEHHAFRVPYDGSNKFYDDVDFKASKEGYIAGAEPREKLIVKLEKLNKNQAESLGVTLLEEEKKAKRIRDLEKENAEIKAKFLHITDEGTSWAHLKNLEDENKRLLESCEGATMIYQDLCKAREIIRSLLAYCKNYPQQVLEKIQQAEQFLKEDM